MKISAKDRLAKVRLLHKPHPSEQGSLDLICCACANSEPDHYWDDGYDPEELWPCETAKAVFTRDQVRAHLGPIAAKKKLILAWLAAEEEWMKGCRVRAYAEHVRRHPSVEQMRLKGKAIAEWDAEMARQRAAATPVDPLDEPIPYAVVITAETPAPPHVPLVSEYDNECVPGCRCDWCMSE